MVAKIKKTKKARFAREARRGSRQNIFFSVLLGVLLFVVVGFLIISNWRINQKRTEYQAQIEVLQAELQVLETKRQQLQAQIFQTSEESYLEKEAREQLNLKKPGEEVVTVLPAEEETTGEPEKGFWGKVWDKIKFW